jgi:hypothetical protein
MRGLLGERHSSGNDPTVATQKVTISNLFAFHARVLSIRPKPREISKSGPGSQEKAVQGQFKGSSFQLELCERSGLAQFKSSSRPVLDLVA